MRDPAVERDLAPPFYRSDRDCAHRCQSCFAQIHPGSGRLGVQHGVMVGPRGSRRMILVVTCSAHYCMAQREHIADVWHFADVMSEYRPPPADVIEPFRGPMLNARRVSDGRLFVDDPSESRPSRDVDRVAAHKWFTQNLNKRGNP